MTAKIVSDVSTREVADEELTRGVYAPAKATDLRSPCPMINCLANSGYMPRDGRNVRLDEMVSAMNETGCSALVGKFFSHAVFLEHIAEGQSAPQQSFLSKAWSILQNPFELLPHKLGVREAGQVNAQGEKCMNLDQLAKHGAIEHDVSLSRRDFAQGDNITRQADLVKEIISASSDGGHTATMQDMCALRRRRISAQRQDNKELGYGKLEHELGCGEIALIMKVLGDGHRVRCDYLKAFFEEERLPIKEGWTKRTSWWTIGLVEIKVTVEKIKGIVGPV